MTYLLVASPRDRTAEMETTINESDPTLRISVVIPTFQRAGALQACLLALSVGFPADAEVIVVSDGGDKASFPDLSRFEKHLNLVVIHAEHGGAGHARNQGLQRVQAPIVVFTDDDCLPQAGWLEAIAAQVSLDPPRAAGGKTISHPADNVYATAAQLVLDLMERDQRQKNYEPVFFPSNNIAFPTEALKQIGGFDAGFRTAEDREVCRRWLQAGCQLGKAPDSVLLHVTPLNFAGYWHKLFAYGEGAAQFRAASGAGWVIETRGYHFRIPALAAAEFAERKLVRRLSLSALLVLWEVANLAGFLTWRWKQRKHQRKHSALSGKAG